MTDCSKWPAGNGWTGPLRIGDYLARVVREKDCRPPEGPGVYLLSGREWAGDPDRAAGVVYVGRASYLRYRIGQLFSDLFGFTGEDRADGEAYQHSGGHWLWHRWCVERGFEPANLYLAWRQDWSCLDCAEARLSKLVASEWRTPAARGCTRHRPLLEVSGNRSRTVGLLGATMQVLERSKN